MDTLTHQIEESLAEPFDPAEIKWKPQAVSGNRALAIAYIDARLVQDRLDDVCGVSGWQDHYEFLEDGSVLCKLQLRLGGEWITKMDVGGQSEQSDEGDRRKAAVSDALKRTAVKFGIGRYLYRLPSQWVDYDPQKKCFASTPKLPAWAIPGQKPQQAKQPAKIQDRAEQKSLPTDGAELMARLQNREAKLVAQKRCATGDLIKHVAHQAVLLGHPAEMTQWGQDVIAMTPDWVRTFEAVRSAPAPQSPPAAAPANGKPVTPAMAKQLQTLLDQKRIPWTGPLGMCRHLKVPETTMIEDLTAAQYRQAVQTANEVPS